MSSRSSSSQFRPLIIPQHTDCLLTLTYAHCKTRDVFALLPHNDRTKFTRCISCPAHSHNFQPKKIFSFQTMYIARKHKLDFHQMLRKTLASQCCLLFLSLSLSRILLQQSLGQVLGVAESSSLAPSFPAANRTSPHSFLPGFLTSASSCPPSSYLVLLSSTMFRSLQNYPPDLLPHHQNLHWLPLEAFRKSSTPFHPSPTACRHCLLLLINSAPYLPIISSHQFSWTTQHTPANTMQAMQLHAVVNGAPQ